MDWRDMCDSLQVDIDDTLDCYDSNDNETTPMSSLGLYQPASRPSVLGAGVACVMGLMWVGGGRSLIAKFEDS